ncbi:maltose acetyltransferase domain-containing protein [Paenibacillus sp. 1_12]|uniref:maltose acetyltransferase domain-containing protein n=1 Tax=Paenibacillus sp. 1_12 TaxID=1566278 RepID=UPI000B88C858
MKEKLHNGSLYLPGDEQLSQEQPLYLEKLYDLNQTRPLEQKKRAGSIVTQDIPSKVVSVGNPCRVLRKIIDEHDRQY